MGRYHDILGVSENASKEEIKKAYRAKAKELHPDVNSDDPEANARFTQVKEAYEKLINDEPRTGGVTFKHAEAYRHRKRMAMSKLDPKILNSKVLVEVALRSVYMNKLSKFTTKVYDKCDHCAGSGDDLRYSVKCDTCNGSGVLTPAGFTSAGHLLGFQCPGCDGRGHLFTTDCRHCEGTGTKTMNMPLEFNVSKLRENTSFNYKGTYDPRIGDYRYLNIHVVLQPQDGFTVSGDDLIYELPVHFKDVLDKKRLQVTHVDGKAYKFDCPDKANTGTIVKLSKLGLVKDELMGTRGDLLVRLLINIDYDRL